MKSKICFYKILKIIPTIRENEKIREKSLEVGVSQISAGSSTGVGCYPTKEKFKNRTIRNLRQKKFK